MDADDLSRGATRLRVRSVATLGDLLPVLRASTMVTAFRKVSVAKEVRMVRLVRTLVVSVGLSLAALIAVPVGSELAVEHLNVSAASPLGQLGATAAGACGYRTFKSGWVDH